MELNHRPLEDRVQIARRYHHLADVPRPWREREAADRLRVVGEQRVERDDHEHALVVIRVLGRTRAGDVVPVRERVPGTDLPAGAKTALYLAAHAVVAREKAADARRGGDVLR